MSYSLFEKKSLLVSYDNPYTYFLQCVEYNKGEQSRQFFPAIQNLVTKILSLCLDIDLR
jgi:hypothetical protein